MVVIPISGRKVNDGILRLNILLDWRLYILLRFENNFKFHFSPDSYRTVNEIGKG